MNWILIWAIVVLAQKENLANIYGMVNAVPLIGPAREINPFIRHWEAANFDRTILDHVHQKHKEQIYRRRKRDLNSSEYEKSNIIKLNFFAHDREFRLVLRQDPVSVFSPDVKIENTEGPVDYDISRIYTGSLEDDENSHVHAILTSDNLLDGTISTRTEQYYVEPSQRYSDQLYKAGIHSIVYKLSDVKILKSAFPRMSITAIPTETTTKTTVTLPTKSSQVDVPTDISVEHCASEKLQQKLLKQHIKQQQHLQHQLEQQQNENFKTTRRKQNLSNESRSNKNNKMNKTDDDGKENINLSNNSKEFLRNSQRNLKHSLKNEGKQQQQRKLNNENIRNYEIFNENIKNKISKGNTIKIINGIEKTDRRSQSDNTDVNNTFDAHENDDGNHEDITSGFHQIFVKNDVSMSHNRRQKRWLPDELSDNQNPPLPLDLEVPYNDDLSLFEHALSKSSSESTKDNTKTTSIPNVQSDADYVARIKSIDDSNNPNYNSNNNNSSLNYNNNNQFGSDSFRSHGISLDGGNNGMNSNGFVFSKQNRNRNILLNEYNPNNSNLNSRNRYNNNILLNNFNSTNLTTRFNNFFNNDFSLNSNSNNNNNNYNQNNNNNENSNYNFGNLFNFGINSGSGSTSRPSHKTHVEIITKNGATKKPNIIVNNYNPDLILTSQNFNSHLNLNIRNDIQENANSARSSSSSSYDRKSTCMLYLQADHTFFQKMGSDEASIEAITRHVQRANAIYRNTDFNGDGKPDNITFMIKRIKVHNANALKDPNYRFPGNYGVEKFLELFSEEDYDAFCLAYMFTYRDFEMGTLGLAWTGDLKNAGGVCEKNGHYRGSLKSLNTGIVTLLNYGKHVPPAVSHVTLAHEIGHNFGSPHDPEQCTPGGEDGNYIMFARATSGDKRNNNKFSPCSLKAIEPVLNAKARSAKGCFTEPQQSICGNGVVEPGEQCDCGWEEDCKDSCCFPMSRHPRLDEKPCTLTQRAMCSPSQGPCCTADCSLKFGDKCRDDNGCRDPSFCDGRAPQCPPSVNKPNKTICNKEFVCYMGECTGSICLAYGLESCQCLPGPNDLKTKSCELCCKQPGEGNICKSSFEWNEPPYDVPDMFAKPGTPCNDYNGYCDVFQKCREVDPSGPLATLRKLLLSEESIASFKKWFHANWYTVVLAAAGLVVILILTMKLLGKRSNKKLKSVTIIHSSTTETVRLPEDNNGVIVHTAVRTKVPFKKKVRGERSSNNKNKKLSSSSATKSNINKKSISGGKSRQLLITKGNKTKVPSNLISNNGNNNSQPTSITTALLVTAAAKKGSSAPITTAATTTAAVPPTTAATTSKMLLKRSTLDATTAAPPKKSIRKKTHRRISIPSLSIGNNNNSGGGGGGSGGAGTSSTDEQQQNKLNELKKNKKNKKHQEIIDYSTNHTNTFGKVQKWLLESPLVAQPLSHIEHASKVRKVISKSQSTPERLVQKSPIKTKSLGNLSNEKVKLQVVYKPPFKFSLKLSKNSTVKTHVIGGGLARNKRNKIRSSNDKNSSNNNNKNRIGITNNSNNNLTNNNSNSNISSNKLFGEKMNSRRAALLLRSINDNLDGGDDDDCKNLTVNNCTTEHDYETLNPKANDNPLYENITKNNFNSTTTTSNDDTHDPLNDDVVSHQYNKSSATAITSSLSSSNSNLNSATFRINRSASNSNIVVANKNVGQKQQSNIFNYNRSNSMTNNNPFMVGNTTSNNLSKPSSMAATSNSNLRKVSDDSISASHLNLNRNYGSTQNLLNNMQHHQPSSQSYFIKSKKRNSLNLKSTNDLKIYQQNDSNLSSQEHQPLSKRSNSNLNLRRENSSSNLKLNNDKLLQPHRNNSNHHQQQHHSTAAAQQQQQHHHHQNRLSTSSSSSSISRASINSNNIPRASLTNNTILQQQQQMGPTFARQISLNLKIMPTQSMPLTNSYSNSNLTSNATNNHSNSILLLNTATTNNSAANTNTNVISHSNSKLINNGTRPQTASCLETRQFEWPTNFQHKLPGGTPTTTSMMTAVGATTSNGKNNYQQQFRQNNNAKINLTKNNDDSTNLPSDLEVMVSDVENLVS